MVLGAYGMLGHRLLLQLASKYEVLGSCRRIKEWVPDSFLPRRLLIEGVEATCFDTVKQCTLDFDPDVVVNCIGIVKQSSLAKSPVPSILINSLFPHQLAELCADRRIRTIHFSTDCVFSGSKGNYGLGAIHDAIDLYGRSKSLGELSESEGITIRSSIVGRELDSSHGLLEWLASNHGKKVRGFTNAIFSGFTTHEMANIVDLVITRNELKGVHQVASTPISKFDLLSLLVNMLKLEIEIDPFPDFYCDRSLDGHEFEAKYGYEAPTWKCMIDTIAKDWYAYDDLKKGFK
jgi:dTDP-4-dehydrorhamnose reductase